MPNSHNTQTDDVIASGQLGPAIVEERFMSLFTQTYEEGRFGSVQDLLAAMAAVVRKEFGAFMVEVQVDGEDRLH